MVYGQDIVAMGPFTAIACIVKRQCGSNSLAGGYTSGFSHEFSFIFFYMIYGQFILASSNGYICIPFAIQYATVSSETRKMVGYSCFYKNCLVFTE